MQTDNRIQVAINKMGTRLKGLSTAKIKTLTDTLTLDPRERYSWLTCQARAHAEGAISSDEAMTLYRAIKNWEGQSVQSRIVTTQSIQELLSKQIKASHAS